MVAHLSFSGFLQPPSVPPDPVGDSWRGPQGFPGQPGPPGSFTASGPLPTTPGAPGSGIWWSNGGVVMIS